VKKVITEAIIEEAKFYCDLHKDRECFSELTISSWCGSKYDMMGIELHLCDECLNIIYDNLYKTFLIKPKEIEL